MTGDHIFFEWIHALVNRNPFLDFLGILFAEYIPYIAGIVFLFVFLRGKSSREVFYRLFLIAMTLIIARGFGVAIVAFLFPRERPFDFYSFTPLVKPPPTNAFPSQHATVFFALAMLETILERRFGVLAFTVAILIGLARIFVGVHWPFDIAAGAILGIAGAYVAYNILPRPAKEPS